MATPRKSHSLRTGPITIRIFQGTRSVGWVARDAGKIIGGGWLNRAGGRWLDATRDAHGNDSPKFAALRKRMLAKVREALARLPRANPVIELHQVAVLS